MSSGGASAVQVTGQPPGITGMHSPIRSRLSCRQWRRTGLEMPSSWRASRNLSTPNCSLLGIGLSQAKTFWYRNILNLPVILCNIYLLRRKNCYMMAMVGPSTRQTSMLVVSMYLVSRGQICPYYIVAWSHLRFSGAS